MTPAQGATPTPVSIGKLLLSAGSVLLSPGSAPKDRAVKLPRPQLVPYTCWKRKSRPRQSASSFPATSSFFSLLYLPEDTNVRSWTYILVEAHYREEFDSYSYGLSKRFSASTRPQIENGKLKQMIVQREPVKKLLSTCEGAYVNRVEWRSSYVEQFWVEFVKYWIQHFHRKKSNFVLVDSFLRTVLPPPPPARIAVKLSFWT